MKFLHMNKIKLNDSLYSKLNSPKGDLKKKNVLLNTKTLNGKALREYKQTITLNQMQREIIVGTLLGDASMPFRKGQPRA